MQISGTKNSKKKKSRRISLGPSKVFAQILITIKSMQYAWLLQVWIFKAISQKKVQPQ